MYIKSCTTCLLYLGILSCNNKASQSENREEVMIQKISDTGEGVDPHVFAGSDSINLNSTYVNTRYGFYLSFPTTEVRMESESDSRDGCIFFTKDNKEFGRVYRVANPDPEAGSISLKKELESDLSYFREQSYGHPVENIYSSLAKSFYVVSAKINHKIYYRKGILLDGDDMGKVIFQYDEQQKAKYDVIVAAMANSFHK
jgi:hypothetical protein